LPNYRIEEKVKIATVLLIEDSKFIRIASQRELMKAGYTVLMAADGEHGLRMARENLPDLILLDMMLPIIAGADVLRMLKEDVLTKHIPVIILSSLSQKTSMKLKQQDVAGYIEKATLVDGDSKVIVQALEAAAGLQALTQSDGAAGNVTSRAIAAVS
jgi:twitching motility two-component system response regulator PilH